MAVCLISGCVLLRHWANAVDLPNEVVPIAHLRQAPAPCAGWYVPTAQSWQAVIEPSP